MHAVGSQTWIILACLAFMSHWCKHICCESIVHKTENELEQTIAEKKIPYGRNGLERNRFHKALNFPSHRDINENKHTTRSVNHESVDCGKRPLMERKRSRRDVSEKKQVAPPPKPEKIVGGTNAVKGANPWQVGVRVQNRPIRGSSVHLCGGTILSKYWILSAAHCFVKLQLQKDDIFVRVGDYNNEAFDDHEQEFKVDVLITHELFNAETLDYDLALIKIRHQDGLGIVFNDYVQPACLPENNTEYEEGVKCHISGWGTTHPTNKTWYANVLQAAVVPIINDSVCNSLYKGEITPRMFCADVGSCYGDSGGPFVCDIQGKYTVIGAVSWGDGCADHNTPGVYAKVKEFLPWIKEKIEHAISCLYKSAISCFFHRYYYAIWLLQKINI